MGSRYRGAGGVRTGQSDGSSGQLAALPSATWRSGPGARAQGHDFFFFFLFKQPARALVCSSEV